MKIYKLYILILVLFLATPLRAAVLVVMPIALLLVYKIHPYKVSKKSYILAAIFGISGLFGILSGTISFANFFLSAYIIMPLLILLFAIPVPKIQDNKNKLSLFIKYLVRTLAIINILGIIAYFVVYHAQDDDALHFAYGAHFAGVNGLAMLNVCVFFYYLSLIINGNRQTRILGTAMFFFICFIFCFFGTALICLILTLVLFSLFRAKLKQGLIIAMAFFVGAYAFETLNPRTFSYMINSLTIGDDLPRKLIMFNSYSTYVAENPLRSSVGVGPGGYNGRVAFLLNNESDNIFTAIFGHQMPTYHAKSIFPLWNKASADFESFTDGARNKPFSSIVSISAENGILFAILFLFYYISAFLKVRKSLNVPNNLVYFLIFVFWLLVLSVDMWLESSEFLFFIVFQYLLRADFALVKDQNEDNDQRNLNLEPTYE